MKQRIVRSLAALLLLTVSLHAQSSPNIHQANLREANPKTPEISTDQMRKLLADNCRCSVGAAAPKLPHTAPPCAKGVRRKCSNASLKIIPEIRKT